MAQPGCGAAAGCAGGAAPGELLARFEDVTFLQRFLIDNARRLGMAGKLLFPIPDRGLAERLYRVRARTTLVWGGSDRLLAPAYADAFQRLRELAPPPA